MTVVAKKKVFPKENCWSISIKHEVARIKQWPAVNKESLSVEEKDENILIKFQIRTDQLIEPKETRILDVEPISLVYKGESNVGIKAPMVWSGRKDFPRDIGHINPTRPDEPASICLARASLQVIYDRYGVTGIMQRLTDWLHDAKTGQLMKDGWEPTPLPEGQNFDFADYDIGEFQDIATLYPNGNWACGTADLISIEKSRVFQFCAQPIEREQSEAVQEAQNILSNIPARDSGNPSRIPWIFIWPDESEPSPAQVFKPWNTLGEIVEGAQEIGLSEKIQSSIVQTMLLLGENADLNGQGGRSYLLLVGVWRPLPLANHIYGLSKNPQARKLEIRAFVLDRDRLSNNPIADNIIAKQLVSMCPLKRDMLEFTSGLSDLKPVAMIGYGALGSTIADFFLRSGVSRISVMDKDKLEPHNVARHTGIRFHVHHPKVDGFKALGRQFFQDDSGIFSEKLDVLEIADKDIEFFCSETGILIDATADERVRGRLSSFTLPKGVRLARMEIFNQGRLGVLFLAGSDNNPNLIDLYYHLCFLAMENDEVSTWLRGEEQNNGKIEELTIGFGCSSPTVRMPKHIVTQHASAFMPSLISNRNKEAGIGINPLNSCGQPSGWQWFSVPAVTVLKPRNAEEWEVRLSNHALEKLNCLREKNGLAEVGGYLYGGIDYNLRQIYVVEVSDLPPDSKQTATSLNLGPSGQTPKERKLNRRSGGKVSLVGTWHSHPSSDPFMSKKDKKTMEKFYPEDSENGVPTLLVITSPKGTQTYLWT